MSQKLKPYREYKDAGLPWLGKIPAHWKIYRAKCLFNKVERDISTEDEVVTCFRDGTVTLRKNRRLRGFTESIKEIGYQGVRKGDLVIHAMDAFAGAIGVSDSDGKCTPVYVICQSRGNFSTYYYAYILREMARTKFILSLARGIRERSTDFRFETFAKQYIPVPSQNEQVDIVNFLDAKAKQINRFIRNKQQLIKLLNEQKQAIINHAVTRGINPNVRLKPSGVTYLGDIPEHWEVMPIKRAFESIDYGISESISDSGKIRVLTMGDINNGQVYIPETGGVNWVSDNLLLKDGDLLYNRTNSAELVGKVGLFKQVNTVGVTYASYLVRFRVKSINNSEFLNYLLNSPKILAIARQLAIPSLHQSNLNPTRYGRILIALPSLSNQTEIVSKINNDCAKIDKLIQINEQQIKLFREYRTRLIADVVTGKMDVRGVPVEKSKEFEGLEDADVREELREGEEIEETEEALDAKD